MYNFYPGPSKIHPQVPAIIAEGFQKGVFEFNHRSAVFHAIYEKAKANVSEFLEIPDDYEVFFVSSATESWQIIAQSVVETSSLHIYNGAFGEKWAKVHQDLGVEIEKLPFSVDQLPEILPQSNADVVCLTHCETSNGTKLPEDFILKVKQKYEDALICIDATSSFGGIPLSADLYDIAFASVQKCFGFPSGLAIMVCSPKTIAKAKKLNQTKHYNALLHLLSNAYKFETTHTPNMMGIYLFSEFKFKNLRVENEILKNRFQKIKNELILKNYQLVGSENLQSETVLCVKMDGNRLQEIYNEAEKKNLVSGKGYGAWKNNSLRIANFPAQTDQEIAFLTQFIAEKF